MRKLPLGLLVLLLLVVRAHPEEDPPSIGELSGKLESDDLKERQHAAWGLWLRREEAGPVAAALCAAMRDADVYVRETSARAVTALLIHAPEAVPELVKGLQDERVEVRRAASRLLAYCYDHVAGAREELIESLSGDEDTEVRANSANSLRLLPSDAAAPAISALVEAARDSAPSVRKQVVAALGWLRSPQLLDLTGVMLADPAASVREAMLEALRWMPDLPDCFVDRAAAMTRDRSPAVRRRAAFLLGRFERSPEVAVPALLAAIRDEASLVRIAAAVSLGVFGAMDARIPPALGRALEEREFWLTKAAVGSLLRTGPSAAGQLPALVMVIRESPAMQNRYAAMSAIDAILGSGIEEVVAALEAESSRDQDNSTVLAAAVLLRLRARDAESLRCLLDALPDEILGDNAARLLSDLDRAVQPAVPELLVMSRGEDVAAVRANFVLVRVAVLEADAALGRLRAILGSESDPRKLQVLRLVGSLGPVAGPLVPELTKLVAAGDPFTAPDAATALGWIGPDARVALPVLLEAAESTTPALSATARIAIARLTTELGASGGEADD